VDMAKLIGRSEFDLKNDIKLGNFLHWNQPQSPRRLIPIDAVLAVLFQLFCREFNLKPAAVRIALPAMQVMLPAGVDRLSTEMLIALGQKHPRFPRPLGVGCGTLDELREGGFFDAKTYAANWHLPIILATAAVRARAKEHGITLPNTFTPDVPPLRARTLPLKYRSPDGKLTTVWSPINKFVQVPGEIVN
jgi:hypothetical protein